jgi:predicted DNA-binding transcriptional regulator YafY
MTQELRILQIISSLSDYKPLCLDELTLCFDTSMRTIQRDMSVIKKFLGSSLISPQRGCYQLLDTNIFANFLNSSDKSLQLKEFFEFLAIFDTQAIKFIDDEKFAFFHKIKKESSKVYSIFDSPIEELKNTKFLEDIKSSIINRQYCDIVYDEKEPILLEDLEPQKILYAKNNWYLAVVSKDSFQENGGFKRLRINFIEDFKLKSKTFHSNLQAQEFIKNMQSLFEMYDSPKYEARVRVDYKVSRYFKVKRFLTSQKIESVEENGDLILSFSINNDMELIPLIKIWLPHLKVISPKRLDEKIKEQIALY